jgi:hypothetical protein
MLQTNEILEITMVNHGDAYHLLPNVDAVKSELIKYAKIWEPGHTENAYSKVADKVIKGWL